MLLSLNIVTSRSCNIPTLPYWCLQSTVVSEADSLLYDAVWAVALAFNHSTVNVSREGFRMELNSLSFAGSSVCQATADF